LFWSLAKYRVYIRWSITTFTNFTPNINFVTGTFFFGNFSLFLMFNSANSQLSKAQILRYKYHSNIRAPNSVGLFGWIVITRQVLFGESQSVHSPVETQGSSTRTTRFPRRIKALIRPSSRIVTEPPTPTLASKGISSKTLLTASSLDKQRKP
jgi:hypothetical protein